MQAVGGPQGWPLTPFPQKGSVRNWQDLGKSSPAVQAAGDPPGGPVAGCSQGGCHQVHVLHSCRSGCQLFPLWHPLLSRLNTTESSPRLLLRRRLTRQPVRIVAATGLRSATDSSPESPLRRRPTLQSIYIAAATGLRSATVVLQRGQAVKHSAPLTCRLKQMAIAHATAPILLLLLCNLATFCASFARSGRSESA